MEGRERKERISCPVSDSGDLHMSPECVVLSDMSDSDGHFGPGIQHFPLLPIPLVRPLYPCDKMRRRRVSLSATVFVFLPLTHSLAHSLEFSVPVSLFMLNFFLLIPTALLPSLHVFFLIVVFLLTCLLFDILPLSHPFILLFCLSLSLSVLCLHFLEWQLWSG